MSDVSNQQSSDENTVDTKQFSRLLDKWQPRAFELASLSMKQEFDKEFLQLAASVYALGFKDVQKLIQSEKAKAIQEFAEKLMEDRVNHYTAWGGAQGEAVPVATIKQLMQEYGE